MPLLEQQALKVTAIFADKPAAEKMAAQLSSSPGVRRKETETGFKLLAVMRTADGTPKWCRFFELRMIAVPGTKKQVPQVHYDERIITIKA